MIAVQIMKPENFRVLQGPVARDSLGYALGYTLGYALRHCIPVAQTGHRKQME
jgi:hypothetical protein